MNIQILETQLISSSPSTLQFDPLPLSHLDNDANLRIPFRTLRAFSGDSSQSTADPSATIAAALSKALTFYRPLAASLRSDPSNFHLHSHLSSPAEVLLVIASASDPLHAVLRLFDAEPGSPILDRLAPDANPDEALARPLALQITRFACGGFALGMCVHHALCDGAGASQFLAARIKAKKLDGREVVKFVYSMSIKKIVIPQLPSGYWGNSCVPVYIQSTAKELLEKPLWKIAMEIKKSKEQVTNKYLRSFIDFQELHYEKGITAGKEVSAFTDWRHLGHSEVDFGWGSSIAVSPLSWRLLGSNEPSFLLPYAESEGEKRDGFRVLVCLPMDAMALFRLEMEIFGECKFKVCL
ncbi:Taxadien-5-alpha-ol O-acetyltransferase [Dendrobium catenatum]|uniref:Taxadien-5-alpha-ol O-acetyltransferase n=1 Tax=Dendrobium catenatum TaxID=906689 RepID=A0A2I0X021_9ASPA|nr:Taxadien-5-alpha-ol O-acetyltransferase [Dendrobium catenatum]